MNDGNIDLSLNCQHWLSIFSRCATEAETRGAICNELQLQAQKREAEFRVQLEEAEERARARADKRLERWKRRMLSESGTSIDTEKAIQFAKQKVYYHDKISVAKGS